MKIRSLFLPTIPTIGIGFCLFLSSCNPIYYQPNMQNVLVLKDKKDVAVGGAANFNSSFGEGNYAFNLHGAFAFDKQFGVGFNTDAIKVTDDYNGGQGGITELGLCYFKKIDKGIHFNNYVWLGFGNVENYFKYHVGTDTAEERTLKAKFNRIAIQPSFSFTHRNIGITLSAKLSSNTYNSIEDHLGPKAFNKVSGGYLSNHKKNIILEPGITLKYGKEHFNVFVQYVYASNLSHHDFPMENIALGLGLSYIFNLGPKQLVTK